MARVIDLKTSIPGPRSQALGARRAKAVPKGVPMTTPIAIVQADNAVVTDAATFFALVRTHTLQGTFSDPYYGGNVNFVGWDMVGYPGVRVAVTADGTWVTGSEDGRVRRWRDGALVAEAVARDFVTSVAVGQGGKIACACYDGAIWLEP